MSATVIGALLVRGPVSNAALSVGGAQLAQLMPPATAARVLTVAAVVSAAAASGLALASAAFPLLGRTEPIARLCQWSKHQVPEVADLPWPARVPVAVLAGVLLAAAARYTVRAASHRCRAHLTCRQVRAEHGVGTIIVAEPQAYALAGFLGQVALSTGILDCRRTTGERRALVAHERAHLIHRHHLWIHAAGIVAAANPLLHGVRELVRASIERRADQEAAALVSDRIVTAQALARAVWQPNTRQVTNAPTDRPLSER